MIDRVLGKFIYIVAGLIILALFLILLGGACWVALSIWKAVFALFV